MTITDGKFCVGIPWKQNPINLLSNREVALRHLNGLTKRFQKEISQRDFRKLFTAYSNEMKKFIDSGFIEPGKSDDSDLCPTYPITQSGTQERVP